MTTISGTHTTGRAAYPAADRDAAPPAIAWGAIIGGAFAAAAVSLILMALGTGLGLAAASPWPNAGASITTFGIATAIWLIIIHWFASGFGGYLTGRLRRQWVGLHSHEVFFRDTAHGFLTWAVATVIATAAFASLSAAAISGGAKATAGLATGAAAGLSHAAGPQAQSSDQVDYFADLLFRPTGTASPNPPDAQTRAEATRIIATDLMNGSIPSGDRSYLAQLVAARTGLSQADAQKRVDDVVNQAKAAEAKVREAADQARKAGASLSLFTALAMVIGAFIAAAAGALGGSHRDEWSVMLAARPGTAD